MPITLPSISPFSFPGTNTTPGSATQGISQRFQQNELNSKFHAEWKRLEPQTVFQLVEILSIAFVDLVDKRTGGKKNSVLAKHIADYLSGGPLLSLPGRKAPNLPKEITIIFAKLLSSGSREDHAKTLEKLEFLFKELLKTTQETSLDTKMNRNVGGPGGLGATFFDFIFCKRDDSLPSIFQQDGAKVWGKDTWNSIEDFKTHILNTFLYARGYEGDCEWCSDFLSEREKGVKFHEMNRGLIKSEILYGIRKHPNYQNYRGKTDIGFIRKAHEDIVSYALFSKEEDAKEFRQAILESFKKIDFRDAFEGGCVSNPNRDASSLFTVCAEQAFVQKVDGLPDNPENRKIFQDAIISELRSDSPTVFVDARLVAFAFLDKSRFYELTSWEAVKIQKEPALIEFDYLEEESGQAENDSNRALLQSALIDWAKVCKMGLNSDEIFYTALFELDAPQAHQEKFHEFKSVFTNRFKERIHTFPTELRHRVNNYLFFEGSSKDEKLLGEVAFHAWLRMQGMFWLDSGRPDRVGSEQAMFDRLTSGRLDIDLGSIKEGELQALLAKFQKKGVSSLDFLSDNLFRFSKDHAGMIEEFIKNGRM